MVAYSATKYTCKRHPLRWRREQAMAIIEAACADSLPCKVEGFRVWGGGLESQAYDGYSASCLLHSLSWHSGNVLGICQRPLNLSWACDVQELTSRRDPPEGTETRTL